MATNSNGVNHRNYYGSIWANWVIKALGPQPTNDQFAVIHGLKARPGKQALACAMALRDTGVTGNEIKGAVSLLDGGANPQLNKMRGLVDLAKVMAWVPMPDRNGLHVYRIKLTPHGQAMLKGNASAPIHATAALKATAPKPKPHAKVTLTTKPPKARVAKGKPAPTGAPIQAPAAKPASEAPKPAATPTRTVMTNDGPKPAGGQPHQGDAK